MAAATGDAARLPVLRAVGLGLSLYARRVVAFIAIGVAGVLPLSFAQFNTDELISEIGLVGGIFLLMALVVLGVACVVGSVSAGVARLRDSDHGIVPLGGTVLRVLPLLWGLLLLAGTALVAWLFVGTLPAVILVRSIAPTGTLWDWVLWMAIVMPPVAYLTVVFWVAIPALVVERVGILAALRRSAILTRGSRLRIAILALPCVAAVLATMFGAGYVIANVPFGPGLPDWWELQAMQLCAVIGLGSLSAVSAATYQQLVAMEQDASRRAAIVAFD